MAPIFDFDEPFDAVFTNATLHWIHDADGVIKSVYNSLKPGGRFVGEFGGKGNNQIDAGSQHNCALKAWIYQRATSLSPGIFPRQQNMPPNWKPQVSG